MSIDLGEVTVLLGQRDSGKSVLLEHLMSQMGRYVTIDHLYNHAPPNSTDVTDFAGFVRAWQSGQTRINIRDPSIKDTERFDDWMRLLGQIENYYLIIDEVHKWTNANYCPPVFSDIVQTHTSHGNVGLITSCRQAKSLPTEIWAEANNYAIFHYGSYEDSKIRDLEIGSEHKQKIHEIDPHSHKFLFHRNRTGYEPRIMGPVPLPNHLY